MQAYIKGNPLTRDFDYSWLTNPDAYRRDFFIFGKPTSALPMKILVYLLFLIPCLAFSQSQNAAELRAKDLKKYEVKSAEIQYEITGDAQGVEMMVFDSHGWQSLRTSTMSFELYGITSKQTLLEITDGDFVYRLNGEDSTYITRKDLKWSRQASYRDPSQVSEAILFGMGGTNKADSTLLNRSCEVWVFEGKAIQELWIWNGLVLKRKAKLGDRLIITTATSIDTDIEPLKSIFQIPDFYQEKN